MKIRIEGSTITKAGNRATYMASPSEQIEYNWEVTGGKIVKGENMPAITVQWEREGPQHVSLSVRNFRNEVQKNKILVKVESTRE